MGFRVLATGEKSLLRTTALLFFLVFNRRRTLGAIGAASDGDCTL
jgi:hypothetical protein